MKYHTHSGCVSMCVCVSVCVCAVADLGFDEGGFVFAGFANHAHFRQKPRPFT